MKRYANDKGEFTLCRARVAGEEETRCDACGGSGYKGRLGLHELLIGTDNAKKLIQEHARVSDLLARALEDGMRTLKQEGMEKVLQGGLQGGLQGVLQGLTDMKQVRAVCIK